MRYAILLILTFPSLSSIYESKTIFSATHLEFQPNYSTQLLSTNTVKSKLLCTAACNQLTACRTFDYDLVSQRCRLYEADTTTGSIIPSSSSSSVVGTVRISSTLYSPTHNQPCQACQETRYEVCSTNTSTCQCPSHTYWNGSVCALQLLQNSTCVPGDSCRSDLNLTCTPDCYGYSYTCSPTVFDSAMPSSPMRYGVTVAGGCNGSSSTNQTLLAVPNGILLDSNNTLYFGDNSYRLLAFASNNRTAQVLHTYTNWPAFSVLDNGRSNIYVTVPGEQLVYTWPANKTIPPNGVPISSCLYSGIWNPIGVAIDSVGNVYVSSILCHWVMKWAPNATNATIVAGRSNGTAGSDNTSLYRPYNLALDEVNSYLYVADRYNHRVQRFMLGGNGVGVTVAGGNGQGTAANQLYRPTDIHLSRIDGSLYVADCNSNRVQKWQPNATSGITIAGSSNGTAGSTAYLLNSAYGIAIDPTETYLYVADANNNRIQRFSLH